MDIRSLAVIQAILSEGSYQKAAQRLNCSQSTVTFQVRRLENELSLQIFERVGRRMVLSRAGKDLLPHMEAVLNGMRSILNYRDGNDITGELRLAVAESLLACKIPPVLGRFSRLAPGVRLTLHCLNCHDIRNGLLSGEYDMGIYYDVGGHTQSLSLSRVGRTEGVLAASPDLPTSLRDFISPHQQKNVSLITSEPRSIYRERMEAYLRTKDIMLRSTVEVWNMQAIKTCTADGMGVAFLPRFAVERELSSGALVEIPVDMQDNSIDILCVHHRNQEPGPALRLFRSLLMEEMKNSMP